MWRKQILRQTTHTDTHGAHTCSSVYYIERFHRSYYYYRSLLLLFRSSFYFFYSFIAIIFLFNLIKNDIIISIVTRRRIHFRPGRFVRDGEHIPFIITPATESGHKSIYVYQYHI